MRKHRHINAGMIYVDIEREREGERQTRSVDKEWKLYCRDRHNTTCLHSQWWRHHTSIYRTLHVFCRGHCFFFDVFQGIMRLTKKTFAICHRRAEGSNAELLFEAEVPEYLAPAQEQGAIMIGVTGYPGVLPFLFWYCQFLSLHVVYHVDYVMLCFHFFCFELFQRCFGDWLDSCTNFCSFA